MNYFIVIILLLLSFNFKILATSPNSQQDRHSTSSSDNSLKSYHSTASSFDNSPERERSSPKQHNKEIIWQDKRIVERHDKIQWHDKHVAKDKHIIHQGGSGASSSSSRIRPLIGEVSTLSAGHLSRSPPRTSPPRTSSPRNRITPTREAISFSPSPSRERRISSHNNHLQLDQPSTSRSRQLTQSEGFHIDMLPQIYNNYVNHLRSTGQLQSQMNSRSRSPDAISSNRQIQQQAEENRTSARQTPSHDRSNSLSPQRTTRMGGRNVRRLG